MANQVPFLHKMPLVDMKYDEALQKYVFHRNKRSNFLFECLHLKDLQRVDYPVRFPKIPLLKDLCAVVVVANYSDSTLKESLPADVYEYIKDDHVCNICSTPRFGKVDFPACAGLKHCAKCELQHNLWICLTCGYFACGRPVPPVKQVEDFKGGNGHALQHYEDSHHPIVCKLRSSSIAYADIFCYKCDNAIKDVNIAEHLLSFEIILKDLPKIEPSFEEIEEQRTKEARKFFQERYVENGLFVDPE